MAKITRKNQLIFGSDAGSQGIVEYGSPALGTPVASTDPDDIQTAAWETGWAAAALAGTEIPTFQDFNAIHFVATRQLAYLLQEGIPEFSLETEYYQNSIVKKTGTYELYGSIGDANLGNALPSQADDANWQYLGNLADIVNINTNTGILHVEDNKTSGTNGQSITAGSFVKRDLNTVKKNTITGSSLSSSIVTLPAGTYRAYLSTAVTGARNAFATRLRDTTNSVDLIIGVSGDADDSCGSANLISVGRGDFTLVGSTNIELQVRVTSTGICGTPAGMGISEVYSILVIEEI